MYIAYTPYKTISLYAHVHTHIHSCFVSWTIFQNKDTRWGSAEKLTLPPVPGPAPTEGVGEGSPPLVSLKQLQEALRSGPQPSTAESQGRGKLPTPSQEKYSLNFTYFPRTS